MSELDSLIYDILEITDDEPNLTEAQIIECLIARGVSAELAADALYSTPGYW